MSAFGRHVLAPVLPAFMAQHPRLELELLIADRHVDVLKEDFDLSLRYRDVLEPGMTVRQLASVPRILCASPAYLAQHGSPQTAQDLLDHPCLVYRRERDGRLMRWPFLRNGPRAGPQQRIAAIGIDIGSLTEFSVAGGIVWAGSFIVHEQVRLGRLVSLALKPARKGQLQFEDTPLDFLSASKTANMCPPRPEPWWTICWRFCRSVPRCVGWSCLKIRCCDSDLNSLRVRLEAAANLINHASYQLGVLFCGCRIGSTAFPCTWLNNDAAILHTASIQIIDSGTSLAGVMNKRRKRTGGSFPVLS